VMQVSVMLRLCLMCCSVCDAGFSDAGFSDVVFDVLQSV